MRGETDMKRQKESHQSKDDKLPSSFAISNPLPAEVWIEILKHLSLTDIKALRRVNRNFKNITEIRAAFKIYIENSLPHVFLNAQEEYRSLVELIERLTKLVNNEKKPLDASTKKQELLLIDSLTESQENFWQKKFFDAYRQNKSEGLYSSKNYQLLKKCILDGDLETIKRVMKDKNHLWGTLFITNEDVGLSLLKLAVTEKKQFILDYFYKQYNQIPKKENLKTVKKLIYEPRFKMSKLKWAMACNQPLTTIKELSTHPYPNKLQYLLSYAVLSDNLDLVKRILNDEELQNFSPITEVILNREATTPLFIAIEGNKTEITYALLESYLLKLNNTLNKKNNSLTPEEANYFNQKRLNKDLLHVACSHGDLRTIASLVELGANINSYSHGKYDLEFGVKFILPLYQARKYPLVVNYLLKNGAKLLPFFKGGTDNILDRALISNDLVTLYFLFDSPTLVERNQLKTIKKIKKRLQQAGIYPLSISSHSTPLELAKGFLKWFRNNIQDFVQVNVKQIFNHLNNLIKALNQQTEKVFNQDIFLALYKVHMDEIKDPYLDAIVDIVNRSLYQSQLYLEQVKEFCVKMRESNLSLTKKLEQILEDDLEPSFKVAKITQEIDDYIIKHTEDKHTEDTTIANLINYGLITRKYLEEASELIKVKEEFEVLGIPSASTSNNNSKREKTGDYAKSSSFFKRFLTKKSGEKKLSHSTDDNTSTSGLKLDEYKTLETQRSLLIKTKATDTLSRPSTSQNEETETNSQDSPPSPKRKPK